MLGNIYNCIDLDFKGLWKLQMDKFIWSQNDPHIKNDKYLIILVSVYLSYMDDWKKAPEAYFAKNKYRILMCNINHDHVIKPYVLIWYPFTNMILHAHWK